MLIEDETSQEDCVTIVSGLPRSGTSMMMQMLAAGGIPVLVGDRCGADDDNPGGYFEVPDMHRFGADQHRVEEAVGKAVKIFYRSLYGLPDGYQYRVIFMRRALHEMIASQHGWARRHGCELRPVSDQQRLLGILGRRLDDAVKWLHRRPNFAVLEVDYHQVLEQPEVVVRDVNRFLDGRLNIAVMLQVPDPSLYRVRLGEVALAVAGG